MQCISTQFISCLSHLEIALRNVSMFFRSEPNWQVVEPLRDVGWRFRKQFYLINNKADPKQQRYILSWVGWGVGGASATSSPGWVEGWVGLALHPFLGGLGGGWGGMVTWLSKIQFVCIPL